MSITNESVQHVAELAMLSLDQPAIDKATEKLNQVLNLIDNLQAVDTDDVEPLAHPLDAIQILRADEVTKQNNRDALLSNAPESQDGQFVVPRVVE
ncbi:Asp-tRNA(Asn)/Glu-tRNA(Gln) amidotransferase subunit GatC [Umboniibacter marinipuniceus]|uniref:Aspartyl/glutamyl-tRNA(Asn/Gln) amidotransferase subunit C n=1 Tax=Umboniibacter marinipuniceus TaxID=569599 RepID=A0A3M0A9F4_9GAMM|nr:Asp-tRNA(Asn)/Glu-tRNA(Gln) amidotransferase subunit GatC [Umboniibacter marinipuniceus]RMA79458.1 aspartyl/glutamyl-tRNA(Asn/Gln) amidotransferase subunit C [Umboniibacter marinipuniceus]